jgi:hypothetical protein
MAYKGIGFGDDMNDPPNDKLNLPENKLKKAMIDKINSELEELELKKSSLKKRKTEILETVYGPIRVYGNGSRHGKTAAMKAYMDTYNATFERGPL